MDLANVSSLSEQVRDSMLQAKFWINEDQKQCTIHERQGHRAKQTQEVWIHVKNLGFGGQGSVDLQVKEDTLATASPKYRAVKCIRIPEEHNASEHERLYVRELDAIIKFSQIKYEGLFVRTHGWFTHNSNLFIAMDYCRHGDLGAYLSKQCPLHRLPENQVQEIASQVLDALSSMHSEKFAHRDLKPANILIESLPPQPWRVKLGDFGISKRNPGFSDPTTTVRGTPSFLAPELLDRGSGSGISRTASLYAVDMWCFGETMFRLLSGQPAFGTHFEFVRFCLGQTEFSSKLLSDLQISDHAIDFLRSLLVLDPAKRLTSEAASNHPWMTTELQPKPENIVDSVADGIAELPTFNYSPERHVVATEASASWSDALSDVGEISSVQRKPFPGRPNIVRDWIQPVAQPAPALSQLLEPPINGWGKVYAQGDPGDGIGGYDLKSEHDRVFALDYNSTGKQDHLCLYRPGTGTFWILRRDNDQFIPVYQEGCPGEGIGGYDLRHTTDTAFAFDYDSSGKQDHIVLYRPGRGALFILKPEDGEYVPIYAEGHNGDGIGGYDLRSSDDRIFPFDYNHSGRMDHLVLYRPGSGTIWILGKTGSEWEPVFSSQKTGIGGYDLKSDTDRAFAFDYESSGKMDHIALYRPGTGTFWILRNQNGNFSPVYRHSNSRSGIGNYDLRSSSDVAFAYDWNHTGKNDHICLYRPGSGTLWVVRKFGVLFKPVFSEGCPGKGVGGYDLASDRDKVVAFDYDGVNRTDHLVCYRSNGTGTIWILKHTG